MKVSKPSRQKLRINAIFCLYYKNSILVIFDSGFRAPATSDVALADLNSFNQHDVGLDEGARGFRSKELSSAAAASP